MDNLQNFQVFNGYLLIMNKYESLVSNFSTVMQHIVIILKVWPCVMLRIYFDGLLFRIECY